MPHVEGLKAGRVNNWWRYIVDPNQFRASSQFFPPAETDFAGNNAGAWSCSAASATCTLTASTARTISGSHSIKFSTDGAFNTKVRYPKSGAANWDLTSKTYFTFWAYAQNSNANGFQNGSPIVYLRNADGSYFRYRYQGGSSPMSQAKGVWKNFNVPLAGGGGWTRTVSGSPTLGDIDRVEIHNDTWGAGFSIFFDGVGFSTSGTPDTGLPKVSITSPAPNASVSGTLAITVSASDDYSFVSRVSLNVSPYFESQDAVSPYILRWNTLTVPNGPYQIVATAYDWFGNASQTQLTVYVSN
jgi:hypothetical protein